MNYKHKVVLLFVALSMSLGSFSQNLNMKLQNVTVRNAMTELKQRTGYSFVYKGSDIDTDKKVDINAQSLDEAVKQILQGQDNTYEVQGKSIIVHHKVPTSISLKRENDQQQKQNLIKASGRVLDKNGDPIIGATVMQKGTKNGTVTDLNGSYILNVPEGSDLMVSYIGYQNGTIRAKANQNIVLTEDSKALNEVVVVGYGTQKKADLTGSVAVVKMKDVADIPTGNVLSGLQGHVAGMNITTDGTPGGTGTSILVRGKSSFRSDANAPLYVIDGVMTRENISSILSSNDVESIQVLKDAASASIYGAQAANGVIIITTKHAKKGETHLDFNMSQTLQTYHSGFDLLNADEWGQVYWQAYKYANNGATPSSEVYGNGATPKLQDYIGLDGVKVHAVNTDWRKVIYHTALMQNYSATLSKGSDNGSFSLALNYLDDDGLVRNTNFRRINTRISSNYNFLNNRLRIGENVSINRWTQILSPAGVDENAIKQHPAKTVYDENGGYNDALNDVLGDAPNMARLLENEKHNKHEYWRIFGNAYLEIEPIKDLVLRTNFGVNYYDETNKVFEPAWARDDVNKLTQSTNKKFDWVWTNTATYNKTFGKNDLTVMIATEAKKNHLESMFGYGTGLAIEDMDYVYLDNVTAGKNVGAGASNYAMVSYFGKVNYDYERRYLTSVTLRRDASSRLSKGNNADYFPSISAGWRISSEKFMNSTKNWLDDLKLRFSLGVNGNDIIDNEAPYTKYLISLKDASYNLNGDGSTLAPGAYKIRTANPDLKWERTRQINIGIDATLFNNRLSTTFDYFDKKTSNMLVEKPYIALIGEGGDSWYNGGTMSNKGFEMTLGWNDKIKDFKYSIDFNLSYYKNKVTSLDKEIYYTYGGGNGVDKTLVGQPFGSWIGFKTDGLFHTQKEVDDYKSKYNVQFGAPGIGRIKYVDANGDGTIDTNDRVWLGSDNPKVIAGITLDASWKGFDLNMFFNGMIRDAYNNAKYYTDLFQCWNGNHSTRLLDAMHAYEKFEETGVYNCKIPALTTLNNNNEQEVSEFYIENGSFIKLKSLTLGYTLPKAFLDKIKIRNVRFYFQAQNLFTITSYTGADPEGLGYPYPLPRTFSFGLSLGF